MKTRFSIIFLVLAMILGACQPAAPIQEEATAEATRVAVSSDGVALGGDNANGQEGTDSVAPRPEIVWKHDPNTIIVSGTFCCGFTTPLVPLNYIPDFQIWGDGRYIWVVYASDNSSRQVLEGRLSEEQITSLLTKAVDGGFFGWEDRYANELVSDMADKCITINLESTSKTVCEYYEGAPEYFHTLYNNIASGIGLKGTEFIPKRAFMIAYAYPKDVLRPISQDDILWPADTLFPLATAVEKGVWVEGDALLLAWHTVNADPWNATVRDNEGFYNLTLQIPAVSMTQPPVDTQ